MTRQEHFSRLYKEQHKRLDRYVQATVSHKEDAADIIAETTYIAWKKFEALRSEEAFPEFLFGIASRLIRKRINRVKRWKWASIDLLHYRKSNMAGPELLTELKQAMNALNQLPIEQKEALLLFEVSGFSIKEIAGIQQKSESAVKSRLSRGRTTLRQLMGEPLTTQRYEKQI